LFNLRYIARHSNNHTAFICLKSESNDLFIIKVEIEVTKEPGLFSPIELIDFGTMTHLQEPNTISVYLTNTANFENETVEITVNKLISTNSSLSLSFTQFISYFN
jgi:hypothetical protein